MFAVGCVEGRDVHPDVTEDRVGPNSPDLPPLCSRTAGIHHFQRKTRQTGTAEGHTRLLLSCHMTHEANKPHQRPNQGLPDPTVLKQTGQTAPTQGCCELRPLQVSVGTAGTKQTVIRWES